MRRLLLLKLIAGEKIVVIERPKREASQISIIDREGHVTNRVNLGIEFWAAGESEDHSYIYVTNGSGFWRLSYLQLGELKPGGVHLNAEPVNGVPTLEMLPYEGSLQGAVVPEPDVPTMIFQCSSYLIVGTVAGALYFVPLNSSGSDVVRRQVGKSTPQDPKSEPIFDGGCLGNDSAYTIGIASRGQVILCYLKDLKIADHVNYNDDRGHPGLAEIGERGQAPTEFMSIGDLDIRYWDTSSKTLSLRWAAALETSDFPDLGRRYCQIVDL
jgi:hypothetical protein